MTIEGIKSYLERPHGWFFFLASRGFFDNMPDEQYLKKVYRYSLGCEPDFEHPKNFNEKLNWMKLHDRNPLYTQLVDKYEVKRFVAERIGAEHVVPLVGGPWDSVDEIDFDKLPEQFVLKCTHDSGSVLVCRDRSVFDRESAKAKLSKALRRNYYWSNREWPYRDVKPRVIAEACLDSGDASDLLDYKCFCFHGETKILYISNDHGADPRTDFYDMEFRRLPIRMKDPNSINGYPKPACFDELKQLAARLSEGLTHVRVDFYYINGHIYFGEYTMYHNSGFQTITPPEWNDILGSWIRLPTDHIAP